MRLHIRLPIPSARVFLYRKKLEDIVSKIESEKYGKHKINGFTWRRARYWKCFKFMSWQRQFIKEYWPGAKTVKGKKHRDKLEGIISNYM